MYCAYIVELKSLREHLNTDRLKYIFFHTNRKIGLEFTEKNNLIRKKLKLVLNESTE